MTDEQTTEQQSDREGAAGERESEEIAKARKASEEEETAKQKVKELEDHPPERLEDWPDDKAKYETFGGAEGEEGYEESITRKLGPSSLRYREDGSVEIEGEEVDNADEYKREPIPGGPTDHRMKGMRAHGEPDLTEETSIDPENPPTGKGKGEGDSEGSSEEEREDA